MRLRGAIFAALLVAACDGAAGPAGPSSAAVTTSPVFLPGCADGRPQSELDSQGLPPFVPQGPEVSCLLVAQNGGTSYDAGYNAVLKLANGNQVALYERHGGLPVKPGGAQSRRSGSRDVKGTTWTWSVLENGSTTLAATLDDVYVEVSRGGDETQVGALAALAASLRPVEALPRPSARQICESLRITPGPITVAAAFASSAASIVKWEETPTGPNGPLPISFWRQHRGTEPVTVCYLDGDFGPAKAPPPLPGSTATPLPNWNRVVYLVGVNRYPVGVIFGWQDRIPIRDPGP